MIKTILDRATEVLHTLKDKPLAVVDITKPPDLQYARHLTKVVSKLSPIIGNMIEFSIASLLNREDWLNHGEWIRQDPGFPDLLFTGLPEPRPGIEIKTWFPLATEITARFKDSVSHFEHNQTIVVLVAWIPEHLIYGKPRILDVWWDSALSLANARDQHYHNPPNYLVFEPHDTSNRTINLQQTNTNGYRFQGSDEQLRQAEEEVQSWGQNGRVYRPSPDYQQRINRLRALYPYRLDTNFAKIDRIQHAGLEQFKADILATEVLGYSIADWARKHLVDDELLKQLLE